MCLRVRSTSFFGLETVEFNGASFWAESLGSKNDPALILIHSGIATARMWDPIVAALSGDHHVIRYDCREFGRTTTENVVFSDVDDLLAVMAGTGVERATLIGASRGGGIAVDAGVSSRNGKNNTLSRFCALGWRNWSSVYRFSGRLRGSASRGSGALKRERAESTRVNFQ